MKAVAGDVRVAIVGSGDMGGVYAEFQISWPGIPMKDLIIQESRRILATATGSLVTRSP